VLRAVLGEPNRLASWGSIDRAVSSELIRLESLRSIDRARIRLRLPDDQVAEQRAALLTALDAIELVPISAAVLERAAEPFPTLLGSLDAIHLATALLARAQIETLSFATHDVELAVAAQAVGFAVLGA
jgi:predicted nucleic acid-binding protein